MENRNAFCLKNGITVPRSYYCSLKKLTGIQCTIGFLLP